MPKKPRPPKKPNNQGRKRGGVGPGPAYRPSSTGGGTKHQPGSNTSGDCCPMIAAVKSAKDGKWRLAARYARMSARLLAGRIA